MRKVTKIVLHCSASRIIGQNIHLIRQWHVHQNKWKDVGYHFFIRGDGALDIGRDTGEIGAHVEGHNSESIGICLAGLYVTDFTERQFDCLKRLLKLLHKLHPDATIHGHNEFTNKLCPVFDIKPFQKFWDDLRA